MKQINFSPRQLTAWEDQTGKLHDTQASAVNANIDHALCRAVDAYARTHPTLYQQVPVLPLLKFLRFFLEDVNNAEIIAALAGKE